MMAANVLAGFEFVHRAAIRALGLAGFGHIQVHLGVAVPDFHVSLGAGAKHTALGVQVGGQPMARVARGMRRPPTRATGHLQHAAAGEARGEARLNNPTNRRRAMKKVVTVTLGASKQDFEFKTEFLGQPFSVRRLGAASPHLLGAVNDPAPLDQVVQLLRDGEPVKMSKRAGTFVTLADVVQEQLAFLAIGVDEDRLAGAEKAMQRLQHQAIAPERDDDIGLDRVDIAVESGKALACLDGFARVAGDDGDA